MYNGMVNMRVGDSAKVKVVIVNLDFNLTDVQWG